MNVIWKRPDGFYVAAPSDYYTHELSKGYSLWLHKTDKLTYPLRVSGGWEDQKATEELNSLVNLLPCPDEDWLQYIKKLLDNSMDDEAEFFDSLFKWLENLKQHLKGEHWELLVLEQILKAICKRLVRVQEIISQENQ